MHPSAYMNKQESIFVRLSFGFSDFFYAAGICCCSIYVISIFVKEKTREGNEPEREVLGRETRNGKRKNGERWKAVR